MQGLPINGEKTPEDVGNDPRNETVAKLVALVQSVFFQPLKYVTFSTGSRLAGLKSSPV